jgi:hypothetical protein
MWTLMNNKNTLFVTEYGFKCINIESKKTVSKGMSLSAMYIRTIFFSAIKISIAVILKI